MTITEARQRLSACNRQTTALAAEASRLRQFIRSRGAAIDADQAEGETKVQTLQKLSHILGQCRGVLPGK